LVSAEYDRNAVSRLVDRLSTTIAEYIDPASLTQLLDRILQRSLEFAPGS